MKPTELPPILLALLAAGMLAGCTSGGQTTQSGAPQATGRGMRGNFSSADFPGMTQNMTAACQGKSEGDSCYLQTQRGNATGTCQTRNSTLICMGNWHGPYNTSNSG